MRTNKLGFVAESAASLSLFEGVEFIKWCDCRLLICGLKVLGDIFYIRCPTVIGNHTCQVSRVLMGARLFSCVSMLCYVSARSQWSQWTSNNLLEAPFPPHWLYEHETRQIVRVRKDRWTHCVKHQSSLLDYITFQGHLRWDYAESAPVS